MRAFQILIVHDTAADKGAYQNDYDENDDDCGGNPQRSQNPPPRPLNDIAELEDDKRDGQQATEANAPADVLDDLDMMIFLFGVRRRAWKPATPMVDYSMTRQSLAAMSACEASQPT